MAQARDRDAVPFAHFCDLVASAYTQSRPKRAGRRERAGVGVAALFARWRASLVEHEPQNGLGAIVFRFLLPELDVRRRYGLKETLLSRQLVAVLALPAGAARDALLGWRDASATRTGCLGLEVHDALAACDPPRAGRRSEVSLDQVDAWLDELARHSPYSQLPPTRGAVRPVRAILGDLYASLGAFEAAVVTQVILKDLRPLLYPLVASSATVALLDYNAASYEVLGVWQAMRTWHWAMPRVYRVRADLDRAASLVEALPRDPPGDRRQVERLLEPLTAPEMGVPVEIPKAVKGRGVEHALRHFTLGSTVWVEQKYDGERCAEALSA